MNRYKLTKYITAETALHALYQEKNIDVEDIQLLDEDIAEKPKTVGFDSKGKQYNAHRRTKTT